MNKHYTQFSKMWAIIWKVNETEPRPKRNIATSYKRKNIVIIAKHVDCKKVKRVVERKLEMVQNCYLPSNYIIVWPEQFWKRGKKAPLSKMSTIATSWHIAVENWVVKLSWCAHLRVRFTRINICHHKDSRQFHMNEQQIK